MHVVCRPTHQSLEELNLRQSKRRREREMPLPNTSCNGSVGSWKYRQKDYMVAHLLSLYSLFPRLTISKDYKYIWRTAGSSCWLIHTRMISSEYNIFVWAYRFGLLSTRNRHFWYPRMIFVEICERSVNRSRSHLYDQNGFVYTIFTATWPKQMISIS